MRRIARLASIASTCIAMIAIAEHRPADAAWGLDGVVVCNATNTQLGSAAVTDGAGGVIMAWTDLRAGGTPSPSVYLQRVGPSGVPLWAANGILPTSATFPTEIAIASDGAGGAIVTWRHGDPTDRGDLVYAQRVLPSGALAWGANGIAISTVLGSISVPKLKRTPTICADGSSGAFIAWDDGRAGIGTHDIYAQHVNASGVVQWTVDGVPVCVNASSQTLPVITSGAGGTAVVMWYDARNANQDIFAQRINDPSGAVTWTADGVAACNAVGTQSDLRTAANGSTAFAAWTDERTGAGQYNAYMQLLNAASGAGQYGVNGQLVSTVGSGVKRRPAVIYDPIGAGSLVAWQDDRNGNSDIYAQRYDSNGIQIWTNGGLQMTNLANTQESPIVLTDGTSGAWVYWRDVRTDGSSVGMANHIDLNGNLPVGLNGQTMNTTTPTTVKSIVSDGTGGAIVGWEGTAGNDVFAQRIAASTNLGDYDAIVSTVSDLPGDEGGFVRIVTSGASGDFAPGTPPVTGYNVWRQIAPEQLSAPGMRASVDVTTARQRGLVAMSAAGVPGGRARLEPLAAQAAGFPSGTWESLGFNAARGQTGYTIAVPTPSDSSAAGNADRTYVLTVHTTTPSLYAVSNTKAGHSVDNLPPSAPQNATGQLTAPSTVKLDWSANPEGDLAHYAVYRGADASFVPALGNRIGTPTTTTLTDGAFSASYYKISALDRHGNESAFTTVSPGNIVGVPRPTTPAVNFLGAPAPNPFHGRMTIELGLASSGRATLRVFDTGGRLVRTLVEGALDAGVHPVSWDGDDARGRAAPAGVYLLRFESGGQRWTRRVLLAH